MISLKKIIPTLLASLILIQPGFAQRFIDDQDEVEDLLAQEDNSTYIENPGEIDDSLMGANRYVLTLVEAKQNHDLNPKTSTYASDAQIFTGLYEGLFSYDPKTLEPLPAVAVSYKISRDKKRWTFTLRDNARFSDGSPITAEDVKRSWLELLETPGAPYASMLDIIEGAENYRTGKGSAEDVSMTAVSDTVFSIRLNTPASYLPRLLCHAAFSVTHRNPTVYSGAYSLSDIRNNQLFLEKNDFYWDADNVKLKMICFFQSLGKEENTFFYNTGFADWVSSYEIDTGKILNKNAVKINAEFGTEYLFFKTSNAKPASSKCSRVWDNPDFRLAVLEAMPWDTIREGSLVKAETLVYPLTDYPKIEGFSYTDSNEAKLLMSDARKKAGIPEEERIPLYFNMSEGSFPQKHMDAVTEALSPLGIDVYFSFVSFQNYLSEVETCDADIVSYNWIGDFADPLSFLELFRGGSTLNPSGWADSEFDRLIMQAAGVEGKERYQLLGEAEKILMDSGMVLPISHPVSMAIVNTDEIGGWFENAFNIHPLKYLFKKNYTVTIPNVVLAR